MPRRRKIIDTSENDTMEECKKCGRRIHLRFANGLKNGWDVCCGQTMTFVKCPHTFKEIDAAITEAIDSQISHYKKD